MNNEYIGIGILFLFSLVGLYYVHKQVVEKTELSELLYEPKYLIFLEVVVLLMCMVPLVMAYIDYQDAFLLDRDSIVYIGSLCFFYTLIAPTYNLIHGKTGVSLIWFERALILPLFFTVCSLIAFLIYAIVLIFAAFVLLKICWIGQEAQLMDEGKIYQAHRLREIRHKYLK